MAIPTDIEHYSLRLLSPFSGATRVIHLQPVRAISNDGITWRIQLQMPAAITENVNRYTLFGLWSRTDGLKEFPIHLQTGLPDYRHIAEKFIQQLPEFLDQLSFPFYDTVECWLLDKRQQPLALINACQISLPLPTIRQPAWLPCAPNDHTFVSPHFPIATMPNAHGATPVYPSNRVAQHIHQAAGQPRQIQWFQRQTDGSGVGLRNELSDPRLDKRHLPAAAFPHYLIRQEWPDDNIQPLIDDFFQWQSPWLLSLPDLNEQERLQLEQYACHYPHRLHALYHLYPEILQTDLIYKTLVQAKLEKTIPAGN